MLNYTPGPWRVDIFKDGGDWTYTIRTAPRVGGGPRGTAVATVNASVRLYEPSAVHAVGMAAPGNAALLAEAPAMLDLLEEARGYIDFDEGPAARNLRRAIDETMTRIKEAGL